MLLLERKNVDFFYLKRKKEVKNPPFPFNKTSTKIHQNDEERKYIKIYELSAQFDHFLLSE